jgi:hypothetical protein
MARAPGTVATPRVRSERRRVYVADRPPPRVPDLARGAARPPGPAGRRPAVHPAPGALDIRLRVRLAHGLVLGTGPETAVGPRRRRRPPSLRSPASPGGPGGPLRDDAGRRPRREHPRQAVSLHRRATPPSHERERHLSRVVLLPARLPHPPADRRHGLRVQGRVHRRHGLASGSDLVDRDRRGVGVGVRRDAPERPRRRPLPPRSAPARDAGPRSSRPLVRDPRPSAPGSADRRLARRAAHSRRGTSASIPLG